MPYSVSVLLTNAQPVHTGHTTKAGAARSVSRLMPAPPLLSILIPTYDYQAGLERILSSLAPVTADVEVLVFDDTPEPSLEAVIARFADTMPGLRYRHNPTHTGAALGAGENWNALLDEAAGGYVLLMHHDETPLDSGFLNALRRRLTGPTPADAYMLDLMLVDEGLRPLRRHVPRRLRRLVPRHWPGYLFRRNVIGPTATLVIRRAVAPRFDPALRWLIDVDFYMKLFMSPLRWVEAPEIRIGSIQRSAGTITAELSARLAEIDAAERKVLAGRYPESRLWLGAPLGAPLRWAEALAWAGLRGAMLVIARLFYK